MQYVKSCNTCGGCETGHTVLCLAARPCHSRSMSTKQLRTVNAVTTEQEAVAVKAVPHERPVLCLRTFCSLLGSAPVACGRWL